MRVRATSRTAAWVAAEYLIGLDTYNTYSGEESYTSSPAAWWNTSWQNRRKLFLDNSLHANNLANFPLLVKLDATQINYGVTQSAGQDLRFVDADGTTVLPYEIELWDEAGTSYVWTKVPQVDQSTSNDYIWMYYNNTAAQDCETDANCPNAVSVWDDGGSNYYVGVWHLKENPDPAAATDCAGGAGTNEFCDSTSNNYDGDSTGSMDVNDQVAGKADGSMDFDGGDDYLETSATLPKPSTTYTVSAWVNLRSLNGDRRFTNYSGST